MLHDIKNDSLRLTYLVRLVALEGSAPNDATIATLKKAHSEIGAAQPTIETAANLISAIGATSKAVNDREKLKQNPLMSTAPSHWSLSKICIVASVFSAMFLVVFATTYFNRIKVSHDGIVAILNDSDLKNVFLVKDELGKPLGDEQIAQVSRIFMTSRIELLHVSTLITGKDFLGNLVHYSWGHVVEIDESNRSLGDASNAKQSDLSAPSPVKRETSVAPLRGEVADSLRLLKESDKTTTVRPANSMEDAFPGRYNAAFNLLDKRRILQSMMSLLGASILPMLYGLFGASVYLLRALLPNQDTLAIGEQTTVDVILRLGLGTVAGLTVGWFNLTSNVAELTTTPFAVAFLAGFSLDLVFSFLTRLVDAFSVSGTSGKAP